MLGRKRNRPGQRRLKILLGLVSELEVNSKEAKIQVQGTIPLTLRKWAPPQANGLFPKVSGKPSTKTQIQRDLENITRNFITLVEVLSWKAATSTRQNQIIMTLHRCPTICQTQRPKEGLFSKNHPTKTYETPANKDHLHLVTIFSQVWSRVATVWRRNYRQWTRMLKIQAQALTTKKTGFLPKMAAIFVGSKDKKRKW